MEPSITAVPWLRRSCVREKGFLGFSKSQDVALPISTSNNNRIWTLRIRQIKHGCSCSNIGCAGVLRQEVVLQCRVVWWSNTLAGHRLARQGGFQVCTRLRADDSPLLRSVSYTSFNVVLGGSHHIPGLSRTACEDEGYILAGTVLQIVRLIWQLTFLQGNWTRHSKTNKGYKSH
jgi:hypothetical protein